MAEHKDFCEKPLLLDVQNRIVDPRFRDTDYRTSQSYVGQAISYQKRLVHYVCPKPGDLADLTDGLLNVHRTLYEGSVPAIIHAAAVSYGFVFIHPFEDGTAGFIVFSSTTFCLWAAQSQEASCFRFPPPC
jgi:hypothetical protein